MNKTFTDRCFMCKQNTTVRRINLCVVGSEGVDLCQSCQNVVIRFINEIGTIANKNKLESIKHD